MNLHVRYASNSTRLQPWLAILIGLAPALLFSSEIAAQGPPERLETSLAPPPATLDGEIDKIFSWATPTTPGCVVAVSQRGKLIVNRAYGLADLERNVPVTPDTIFDAGSLVKQFVAAATLLLVEDGRLSLAEDVRKYIPELPDYGHRVTLDHLLTHTSGVRDWTGIMPLASGDSDALTLTLRQRGLNFTPGDEWSYSNGGYVLLKEIVARTSGLSFSEFTRRRLFDPVGMKSTTYLADMREVVKNRALAYEQAGNGWKLDMLLGNDRGGGGALLSTAADLIIWNEALTNARLGAFVSEKIQEPASLNNQRKLGYGRGLALDTNRGGRVLWHSGAAAGYKSLVSRYPEQGLSIAILCNAGEMADRTMFARRIFDLFVPATTPPAVEPRPTAASGAVTTVEALDLKSKAGLFFGERTGEPLRLGADDGRLRIVGGPPLLTVTKERFRNPRGSLSFMSGDEFELHFLSTDAFELKSMEGVTTRYRRAEPYAPSAADLQAFAGRYQSDEIGGFLDMFPGKGGLMGRANDAPGAGFAFMPVDRDTFQLSRVILRFRRDTAGNVVGLDYSNPLVRNVIFTRLNERGGR